MRITLDLILNAPQTINPALDRELSLRAYKIPVLENLGATNNAFDALNLSDNDLSRLNHMPPLNRLRSLLLANNYITRISPDFFTPIPNLRVLILTNNRLADLADLEPVFGCTKLERLSLLDNPVSQRVHYRYFTIFKAPASLRILDFARIKEKERRAADALFAGERGEALLKDIAPKKVHVEEAEDQAAGDTIAAIKAAIASATSLEEIQRLEKALKSGQIPADLLPAAKEDKEDKEAGDSNATPQAKPESKPDEKTAEEKKPDQPEAPMDES